MASYRTLNGPAKALKTQKARVRHQIDVRTGRRALADIQRLAHDDLMWGLRSMDAENKIAAGLVDFVI